MVSPFFHRALHFTTIQQKSQYKFCSRFYKFILVFEQFMCQHYVSVLVWAVLKTNMVPVVFGKKYNYLSYFEKSPQAIMSENFKKRKIVKLF